ncbi:MAG TPA: hypothetical protein VGM98_16120 [Schlesneria sp.]
MKAVFHNWHRKAGVVTLLITLAVTGLWWRSWTTADYFRFRIGDRQHRLSSTKEYGLAWESWNSAKPWSNEFVVDRSRDDSVVHYRHIVHEVPLVKESPHLLVVLPLLTISACLLLWKPRDGT